MDQQQQRSTGVQAGHQSGHALTRFLCPFCGGVALLVDSSQPMGLRIYQEGDQPSKGYLQISGSEVHVLCPHCQFKWNLGTVAAPSPPPAPPPPLAPPGAMPG